MECLKDHQAIADVLSCRDILDVGELGPVDAVVITRRRHRVSNFILELRSIVRASIKEKFFLLWVDLRRQLWLGRGYTVLWLRRRGLSDGLVAAAETRWLLVTVAIEPDAVEEEDDTEGYGEEDDS